ncbi:hypothetical protein PCL1606_12820 [Pseudomonas chlororaphis]|uniref:Uncharacterized protein n=2 Tax=Pseudomonas chlororaphis TaxID=587753 RepID=A0A0D5XVI6_9PSED|nr:hypothetical protein PCL1606_12820 [Pseudomonas chlororaphis]
MTAMGRALETIADLLGCDGCEHHLNDEQMLGLANAVQALGADIRERGYALYGLAEEERCK